ncbi:hypothetical protein C8R47DRAFT_1072092 [Mycena vitilis]|nr:hypothetical protein C8R47DRAFT_1072092 [Mycena vitilis]
MLFPVPRPRFTARFAAVVLLALVALSLWPVAYKFYCRWLAIARLGHPTFSEVREYERTIPQRQGLYAKGASPKRYVYFSDEAWGSGWNNVFQEQLLNTHLAYLAGRGYIFVDYTPYDHPPFPDTLPNGERHVLRVPMNAFTSGPTGGGSLGPDVNPAVPLAAPLKWWNTVCPKNQVVRIHAAETVKELNFTDATPGYELLMGWANKLRSIEAPCVEVFGGRPFDYILIGGRKVLSMWPSYGSSPTLTQFAWSALVTRALARNHALFSSASPPPYLIREAVRRLSLTSVADSASAPRSLAAFRPYPASAPPIPGLLAIHVRRGDFQKHCAWLADYDGVDFSGWTSFGSPDVHRTGAYPQLPDYRDIPPGVSFHDATLAHCLPTPDQIVAKVRAVRAASASGKKYPAQNLRAVYIATNGEREWVAGLVGLLKADGWDMVSTSLDLELARDEVAISQAIDSAVLVGAETFIGVGFSSMTSNVVQLRLAAGRHPDTIRLW